MKTLSASRSRAWLWCAKALLAIAALWLAIVPVLARAQVSAEPATPAPAAVQPAAPAASAAQPAPPARWSAAQVRQAFELADTDSNGRLTRAEAQRLTIMPRSFEDADQNKDGVLGLEEYQAGFAR